MLITVLWLPQKSLAETESLTIKEREFKDPDRLGDVLISPFYIPEYLFRGLFWPLKKFVNFAEEVHLPSRAKDFFSNEDHTIWLYPIVTYSTDDGFSAGLNFKNKDVFDVDKYEIGASAIVYANSDQAYSFSFEKEQAWHQTFFEFNADYSDDSNEDFFGLGQDSEEESEAIYAIKETEVEFEFGYNPNFLENFVFKTQLGYLNFETDSSPADESDPKAQDVFVNISNFGFGQRLDFFSYGAQLIYDDSFPNGHPYKGSVYDFKIVDYKPISKKEFGFNQIDFKYRKFFNILNEDRVIAFGFHHRAVSENGKIIPFNRFASLGRSTLLRGFKSDRFVDKQFVVANLEYRYPIWKTFNPLLGYGLGKIFFDVGKAYQDLSRFDERDLQHAFGFGLSITSPNRFFLDLEMGFGERVQFLVSLNRRI